MVREVVAVVDLEASPHEGSQLLVSPGEDEDEDPTAKPVGREKMVRQGIQLHETDYLSKRGILGATIFDALRLFMTLITTSILLFCSGTLSSYVSALLTAESCFHFIMVASGCCPVQSR